MQGPIDLFTALSRNLSEYKTRFIDPFIPADPGTDPSEYNLEVRSYCILCQASFEDYFEQITQLVMSKTVEAWVLRKKVAKSTITLLKLHGPSLNIPQEDDDDEIKVYDHLRQMLTEAKSRFSKAIFSNHGASVKHLRVLLTTVGVDFFPDVNAKNSIIQLSKSRGAYAHKGSVSYVLSPEDALKYVTDFQVYSKTIRDKIVNALDELS